MSSTNPWDRLSDYFDTTKDEADVPAGAADNILIAWPVVLRFINAHYPTLQRRRVLDFGCGAGSFADQLRALGARITGIDSSMEMIRRAQRAYGGQVEFLVGDSALLRRLPPSSLITSIMAIQFVEDLEALFANLAGALDTPGHLIFAVHNPAYIDADVVRFSNGVEVPLYRRSAHEYNAVAQRFGLHFLLEEYPPFTPEFLAKFPGFDRTDVPEYLILGYERAS